MNSEQGSRGNSNGRPIDRDPRPPDPPPAGDKGGGNQPVGRCSYAEATLRDGKAAFPVITLPRRQPFNKEGKPAVIFTPAEINACTRQMDFALIAKFSSGRPHVSMVEKEFRNSWKVEGPMTVSDLDGRHILVILASEQDVISALTQAPRRVGTSLFRLFKWTPEFHLRKESTIITLWIRFPRLRPDLFNEGVLRCLCQPFGRFLDSDSHTKQRTRCSFARCCVEVDISKNLPHEVWIDTGDGHGWWQEIVYEGNLKYCSKCKIHGHNLADCRKMRHPPQNRTEDQRVLARKEGTTDPNQKERGKLGNEPGEVPSKTQHLNQEWIQVRRKMPSSAEKFPNSQQNQKIMEEEAAEQVPSNFPVLVEEGEIQEIQESEKEEEQEQQQKMLMKKSNSDSNLDQQEKEESFKSKAKEYLIRSHSMNDIPKNLSERRLEYIQEEFQHFHLISKHLQKTKEETLMRLKLMEQRQKQTTSPVEESQQEQSVSIVPETQMGSSQSGKEAGPNQKKKKASQSASKPLTRAAKKHLSPKKK